MRRRRGQRRPASQRGRAGARLLLLLLLALAALGLSRAAASRATDGGLDGDRGRGAGGGKPSRAGPDLAAAAGGRDPVRPAGRGLQFLEGLSAVVSAVAGAIADGGGGGGEKAAAAASGPPDDLAGALEQALITVAEEIAENLCGDGLGALPGQRNAVCECPPNGFGRLRPEAAAGAFSGEWHVQMQSPLHLLPAQRDNGLYCNSWVFDGANGAGVLRMRLNSTQGSEVTVPLDVDLDLGGARATVTGVFSDGLLRGRSSELRLVALDDQAAAEAGPRWAVFVAGAPSTAHPNLDGGVLCSVPIAQEVLSTRAQLANLTIEGVFAVTRRRQPGEATSAALTAGLAGAGLHAGSLHEVHQNNSGHCGL